VNIFYLHSNPDVAARYHCDKHVTKMIVESAQLLSTAHHVLTPNEANPRLYKETHRNYPCALWVRHSLLHYDWVFRLMSSLCHEYSYRFGKKHKTEREVLPLLLLAPRTIDAEALFESPPLCMPEQYWGDDAVLSYRAYYRAEKAGFATYRGVHAPFWLVDCPRCGDLHLTEDDEGACWEFHKHSREYLTGEPRSAD